MTSFGDDRPSVVAARKLLEPEPEPEPDPVCRPARRGTGAAAGIPDPGRNRRHPRSGARHRLRGRPQRRLCRRPCGRPRRWPRAIVRRRPAGLQRGTGAPANHRRRLRHGAAACRRTDRQRGDGTGLATGQGHAESRPARAPRTDVADGARRHRIPARAATAGLADAQPGRRASGARRHRRRTRQGRLARDRRSVGGARRLQDRHRQQPDRCPGVDPLAAPHACLGKDLDWLAP